MTPMASQQWLDGLTAAAEIEGEVVHAAVTLDLDIDSVVTIVRHHARDDRPQGIALDAEHPITIEDRRDTRLVLWSDTAPDRVQFHVPAGRLTIWNAWRDHGGVHAWIGAAGIRQVDLADTEADFGIGLLASDGYPGSDIDLKFDLFVSAAHEAESGTGF